MKISFRTESELKDLLEQWARAEEIPLADFVRKLMRVSARIYRDVGSLHELRKKFGEEASPRERSKSAKGG